MNWRQLVIVLFWVVVVTLITRSFFSAAKQNPTLTNSFLGTSKPPAAPQPRALKPALLEVVNGKTTPIDTYHFEVHYTILNKGESPAQKVIVHILPWLRAITPESEQDLETPVDPTSPIIHEGKDDEIELIKPGEKIDRTVAFDGVSYALPCSNLFPESFQIKFNSK